MLKISDTAEKSAGENRGKHGLIFLIIALLAFGGLGLEMLLAFLIEPLIYGVGLNDFNTAQYIWHWIITCVLWAITAFLILLFSKRKYGIDIFKNKDNIDTLSWVLCFAFLILSVVISFIDWKGFKPAKELAYNGWLKFIFQYIYYIFETVLIYLMIVFGQKAGEAWFKNKAIPYGGILTALTWGLIHWFTKGDIIIGLWGFAMAVMFGAVYLLAKKNIRIAFPFILLMFVL